MVSPLCDTPTRRSDEGGRVSCRVLCDYVCMYTTTSCGGWSANLLDIRLEKCPKKSGKSGFRFLYSCISFFFPEREYQRVNS